MQTTGLSRYIFINKLSIMGNYMHNRFIFFIILSFVNFAIKIQFDYVLRNEYLNAVLSQSFKDIDWSSRCAYYIKVFIYILIGIGAKRVGIPGEYGNGNTAMPIHLSHLECAGIENEIYQCSGNEQPTGCTHSNDVSVECLRK